MMYIFYTDKFSGLEDNILLEAHRAALRFGQKKLLDLCEERIAKWEITCDNVCSLLDQLSDIESMKLRCLKFDKNHAVPVLISDLAAIITKYKHLLTPEESAAFFVNIHNPGSMSLPPWCQCPK
uniref:BLTX10 n=1 Tax=Nephila pilipes TaxID=299642 RepID=A0A076KYQ9_NEPPI|nr:BLTX10 [Nephila pilipes]